MKVNTETGVQNPLKTYLQKHQSPKKNDNYPKSLRIFTLSVTLKTHFKNDCQYSHNIKGITNY